MNKVLLIGRLVREADIRSGKETKVAKFTLAVDRRKEETDFISCVAFGKTAEFVEKYITKGMKVAIEGRWQTGSYTNKEGSKIYTNDCVVEQIEFTEKKETKQDSFMNLPEDIDEIPFPMG